VYPSNYNIILYPSNYNSVNTAVWSIRVIMVMLESLAGTGHKYVRLRPKLADKLERVMFDPVGKRCSLHS